MARYVLEAPDDLMAQAKSAAATEGVSFAEWLRQAALSRLSSPEKVEEFVVGDGVVQQVGTHASHTAVFAPITAEKPVLCELRNPAIPSQKCRLDLGHSEDHAFS